MTIREWLIKLICDEALQEEYAEDPDRVLDASGLQPNQIRVLLSRDSERIRHVIEFEEDYDPKAMSMHLIFLIPMQMHYPSGPSRPSP